MASNSEVLKEYLISLGFRVDAAQQKKYDTSILRSKVNIGGLAKTVLGAMTATQAFVAIWARSMEKLYYSSRKAESSVGNLQAFSFAAKTIGISGEAMQSAIEGVARSMRLSPGLQQLVEGFGVKVVGRDKADVANDLVKALKKMPFAQAAGYASLFGIAPDDLLLWEEGVDKMEQMAKLRKQMAADAGLDTEAAAKAGVEYSNQIREVEELFGILKDTAALAILPMFQQVAGIVKEVLKDWTQVVKSSHVEADGGESIGNRLMESIGYKKVGGGVVLAKGQAGRASRVSGGKVGNTADYDMSMGATGSGAGPQDAASKIAALERKYGIPSGMLWRLYGKESHYGDPKFMHSPAGATGPFQFMPDTAKEFGIEGREMDFDASSDAAARKVSGLLKQYKGDPRLAAAAYNWGQRRLAKVGGDISKAPAETRNYADVVGGKAPTVINQETTIYVASDNPETAGKSVAREQTRVGADMLRNLAGQGVTQ